MTTLYVNTASTAGGDGTTNATSGANRAFATLLEAVNSLPSTLSDAYTIYCDGSGGPDTSAVNQTPFDMTTSAANYLLITAQGTQRANGKWDTSKYYLAVTNTNALYNNIPCHIRIDGIQVQVTVSNGSSYVAIKSANANQTASDIDCRVSNCIVKGVVTSGSLIGFNTRFHAGGGAGGTSSVWNCVAFDCTYGFNNDYNVGAYYNCTAYGCQYGFVEDADMLVVNCLAAATANIGFVGTFEAGSNYNAESDGNGAPGANSRTLQTFTFLDAAGDDYRLALSDTGAKNFGTSDPGSGLFSDDCTGFTRSGSWDIGASEAHASVALTGTATATITEADIVAGGKTIILTVDGDQFVPATGTPTYNAATTKGTTAADSAGGGGARTGDGTLTCTFPSGYTPVAGHFALMIVYSDQGSGSTPSGWSAVTGSPFGGGTEKLDVFYKVLAGGESDPVTTISGSTTNMSHCANMAIYTGVGSIGAIGTASNGTGTPMTAGGITTTQDNSIVCCLCGRGDNENSSGQTFNSSTTGVAERLDGGTAAGNDSQVSMYDKTIATASTATGDGSATTSATDPWVSVIIELVRSTPFADARAAIASGLDSAQSEAAGWDAKVKPNIPVGNVVRTANTVCTITLQAQSDYNITAQETITATVPATALTGASAVVATPTFTVDTLAGGNTGDAALVQDAQAVSSSGTVSVTGTASITQGGNTASASGTIPITGSATLTQDEGISATGVIPLSGTANPAQDGNTVSAAGEIPISGAAEIAQGGDTLSVSGTVAITGTAVLAQEGHTLSADSGAITGSLAITQEEQSLTGAGNVAVAGSTAISQDAQSITAAGTVAVIGSTSLAQGDNSAVAAGTVSITGEAAIPQHSQTTSAAGDTVSGGSLAVTQDSQSVSGVGTVGIQASATLPQVAQWVSGTAIIPITGSSTLIQSQTISASGTVGASNTDEFIIGTVIPLDIIRTVALLTATNSLRNLNARNSVRPI